MQREGSFFLAWALAVEGHNQVSMVTLFCVLLADGSVFPVKVALHEYISKLKDRIKETNPITVQCEADQLKLFLATTKREKKKKKPRRWLKSTDDDVEALERGDIRDRIKQLFEPQEGDIHVLVEVPGPKRRRLGDKVQDASAQWLDDFHALFVKADALPPLASLAAFIESPLPVKIGLDTCTFERTASQVHTSTLEKICVNDTNAHCQKISEHNLLRRLDPPTAGVTKTEFIVYWDTFIRELIATVLAGKGCANRSTSDSTSTSTSGPDMVFVLNDIIVFRGEEEAQFWPIDVPRNELRNKLVWVFGDQVPYMLGYAACGYQCGLNALYLHEGSVETLALGMYNTALVTERFKVVLALLQLCRLLRVSLGCALKPQSAKSRTSLDRVGWSCG